MPNLKNDVENSNLLGQDAKCVIAHILGRKESKKALNILKDFRAGIALKDIFDFAGHNSLYIADDFDEYKKIFDFIAAESPAFSQYLQEAVCCANQGQELSQIILPPVSEYPDKLSLAHITALADGWYYESDIRAKLICDFIKRDKNPTKSAKVIGTALANIRYKKNNPFVKAVTQTFIDKNFQNEACTNIFSDYLLASPEATVSGQTPAKNIIDDFKKEIRKISDNRAREMAFFAAEEKNSPIVQKLYHDDYFSYSAQKAIEFVCALPDNRPDFLLPAAKTLQNVAQESLNQKHRGVFVHLSAALSKRPALVEKLLPFYESAGNLPFEYTGMLFFTALRAPELSGRIMTLLKKSIRSSTFSSKKPLFNLNPVCHILRPKNILTPEAFELTYTFLNDAVSDINQMHIFCKDCLEKLGQSDLSHPESRNIIRTMHRNKILRSSPKDFAVFMADLESFRIENAYTEPLNDYINELKEKTPVKASAYVGHLFKNSLEYKKKFDYFKKEFPVYSDINDDYVCRQPEKHQKMTLQETERLLKTRKLSLLEKTKIFLLLKKFEYLALPENREYCREVAKSLSLNPFYAKSVAFAKFNILDGGKQTLRKVWNKNER